jgi:hypothetical protein
VVISPESKLRSLWTVKALAEPLDISIIHVARQCHLSDLAAPGGARKLHSLLGSNSPGGGLAILSRSGVKLTEMRHDPRGALSVSGTNAAGCTFAVIGVYIPPTSSARKEWRAPLFEWVKQEYRRLTPLFSTVLIGGDFNTRFFSGADGLRFTEDAPPPSAYRHAADSDDSDEDSDWRPRGRRRRARASPWDADTRRFHAWAAELGILPVHGRFRSSPGVRTSRCPSILLRRAESDYIFCASALTRRAGRVPQISTHGRWRRLAACICTERYRASLRCPPAPRSPSTTLAQPAARKKFQCWIDCTQHGTNSRSG